MRKMNAMKKICISILGLWLAMPLAAQQTPVIEFAENRLVLPLGYRNGANPVIQVNINGKGPYNFMFDTGSPGPAKLDERIFNDLKLPVTGEALAGDGSGSNAATFPLTTLQTIELGSYKIKNATAMVRNYNRQKGADSIDGVIGLDFFSQVLVELNFERNELVISKGELSEQDKNVLTMRRRSGVPGVNISIGNKEFDADLDTGNMGWFTLHSSDVTGEMISGEPRIVGTAQTIINSFEIKEAQLKESITVGNMVFEQATIVLNNRLRQPNAGIRFLKQMNITFDMARNKIRLVKNNRTAQKATVAATNDYAGQYGDRTITKDDNGTLYLQRPGGMPLKMLEKKKDEFGLAVAATAVIQFERDKENRIIAIKISRDNGSSWERVEKNS